MRGTGYPPVQGFLSVGAGEAGVFVLSPVRYPFDEASAGGLGGGVPQPMTTMPIAVIKANAKKRFICTPFLRKPTWPRYRRERFPPRARASLYTDTPLSTSIPRRPQEKCKSFVARPSWPWDTGRMPAPPSNSRPYTSPAGGQNLPKGRFVAVAVALASIVGVAVALPLLNDGATTASMTALTPFHPIQGAKRALTPPGFFGYKLPAFLRFSVPV